MDKIIMFEDIKKKSLNDIITLPPSFNISPTMSIEDTLYSIANSIGTIWGMDNFEKMNEKERERHKEFEQRYQDVLKTIPLSVVQRIKHYVIPMLELIPKMFKGDFKDRFRANNDFCEFYCLIDDCVSQYIDSHPNINTDYDFQFESRSIAKLKRDLTHCLNSLITIIPDCGEEDGDKIINLANKLFELNELLNDLFTMEIKERNGLDF